MGSKPEKSTPSPTASSIFLPVGRLSRRGSKSSLSNHVDRETLNEALDNIHNAASNSQSLTVFNEYTNPPASSTANGNKIMTGELQGGLTGFYNKLIGAVSGPKNDENTTSDKRDASAARGNSEVSTSGRREQNEDRFERPPSGRSSQLQSPFVGGFDTAGSEILQKPSKVSSKAPSTVSKPSVPTTPTVKSPKAVPQKNPAGIVGEPSVADSNLNAIQSLKAHSRHTSEQGQTTTLANLNDSNASLPPNFDHAQGASSRAMEPLSSTLGAQDRSLPASTSRLAFHETQQTSHERGQSVSSRHSKELTTGDTTFPQERFDGADEHIGNNAAGGVKLTPVNTRVAERPLSLTAGPDPLKLLDTSSTTQVGTFHTPANQGKSLRPTVDLKPRPIDQMHARISQSHLPGFGPSRRSSSESMFTGRGSDHASAAESGRDGRRDVHRPRDHQEGSVKVAASKAKHSKLLSREFWMRDDNAKDCFSCGEPFTTFRRKHHCRTCGQIFDHKCTILIDGSRFGSLNAIKVCKPCQAIINAHDEDSSDASFDEMDAGESITPQQRTPIIQQNLRSAVQDGNDDTASVYSQTLEQMAKTPTMNLPVRRAINGDDRGFAVLELDTRDRPLPRPSSSRSLKTTRSIGHGHKRYHSRHQHIRTFKAYHEERAPFQRKVGDEPSRGFKPSSFHRDSIIDPDLAQYLSDDASSDDDQSDVFADTDNSLSKSAPDGDKVSLGGLLAAVRKGRSRLAEKSIGSVLGTIRDPDDASVVGSRTSNQPRGSRQRNLSVASSIRQKMSPRPAKDSTPGPGPEVNGNSLPTHQIVPSGGSRMTRSASMRGAGAPAMELNRASLQHVRRLLQQLLRDAKVSRFSSWEQALVPILLRATDDVDPDVQRGDDIDIRHYVKLKKIPGGKPGDTSYVSGLVFTKNLALKSMSRMISQPRILIITFPLEYARHEQHFMSLEPVIRQEREYLANLVGRIAALKPHLLLAQRNVSGLALQFLENANIATAFNVKPTVLEAVSRCTRTRVIHSMDKLAIQPAHLGTCDMFEVKTFVAEGRKKTYLYLSGCLPQLGCTITLRGADRSMLSKIKRITEFMVYVVYNLKLETCLMRDEFALIPSRSSDPADASPQPLQMSRNKIEEPKASSEVSKNSEEAAGVPLSDQSKEEGVVQRHKDVPSIDFRRIESTDSSNIPDDVPVPMFYEDMVEKHQTKILSASPFVKFAQPYLLMRARELERKVAYLKKLRDQDVSDLATGSTATPSRFTLIQPEMVHASLSEASATAREILHAVHDAEYDKALHTYETQKKQWEAFLSGNRNLFDPYAHQNIVVLFSQVSTATSIPCSGPDLLAFSFYNEHEIENQFEADCTLGQYVEDLCMRAGDDCPANACEKKTFEHHRQYVHGEAQISVFVQPQPPRMRGMHDTILMWSQCKICGNETPTIPMSMSTWKYSFGKYLELSFWSSDLHPRAGVCPHDLHRDHLRFFGFRNFALRIHYDAISLLEIAVPRMRIVWEVNNDLRFKNEVYTRIEQRLNKFMVSVKSRLKTINLEAVVPEKVEECQAQVDKMTKKANEEHLSLIKQLQDLYTRSKHWEILRLNQAVRVTQEKAIDWEVAFSNFERDYFPSEKDIRRLATLQLKKIFLDRDVSVTSITSTEEGAVMPVEPTVDERDEDYEATPRASRPRKMTQLSPEKTQSVLQSVMEEHSQPERTGLDQSLESLDQPGSISSTSPQTGPRQTDAVDIRHLDLAVPEGRPPSPSDIKAPEPHTTSSGTHTREEGSAASKASAPNLTDLTAPSSMDNGTTMLSADAVTDTSLRLLHKVQSTRAGDLSSRRTRGEKAHPPPLLRAQSQPAVPPGPRREKSSGSSGTISAINATQGFGSKHVPNSDSINVEAPSNVGEKKLTERLGLGRLKSSKLSKSHSLIPRSIGPRKESRVSNLAKHFEQLSREFEKERIRERKLRNARNRHSRVYPLASSRPIVEVYRNVDDAVQEKDASDESFISHETLVEDAVDIVDDALPASGETHPDQMPPKSFNAEETPAETSETEGDGQDTSRAQSDAEPDEDQSDVDQALHEVMLPDSPEDLSNFSNQDLDMKELPKHERSSLMKILTNFWAERSSSGWAALEYPLRPADHIFADCDIIVREDEPSSIIAFALDSDDYKSKLSEIQDHPGQFGEKHGIDDVESFKADQADVMHSLLRKTGTHLKYQFQEGPAKALCKIFFAEQFDAVRRRCGVSDRIVESLSRCVKWDSKGGKTKSLFLKTLDDRFVLKSLSTVETQAFLKFAPNYFQIMSEAFFHELPSVIAKMLGFYQIIIKNPATGIEYNWYLLVMENLFYDRTDKIKKFDLKGSMRNRKIQSTGESNEVLLDENMVEFIYESPLFAREHSKKVLRSSVHNDTLFLARQNVMDYSLMMAIDESRKELVVGIIDCIRTYTWDKKLESWIKDRGFTGGGKNRPTVTSPKEYKKRFREAMGRYVLEAPGCWHNLMKSGGLVEKRIVQGEIRAVEKGEEAVEREVEVVE